MKEKKDLVNKQKKESERMERKDSRNGSDDDKKGANHIAVNNSSIVKG